MGEVTALMVVMVIMMVTANIHQALAMYQALSVSSLTPHNNCMRCKYNSYPYMSVSYYTHTGILSIHL